MSENEKTQPLGGSLGFVWMPADDEKGAKAAFLTKYGYKPTQSEVITGRLWLGPVPERMGQWVENST